MYRCLFVLLFFMIAACQLSAQVTPAQKATFERGLALVKQNQVEAAGEVLDSLTHNAEGILRQDSFGAVVQFTLGRNFTTPATLDAGLPYFNRSLRMVDSIFPRPHNLRARVRVGLSEGIVSADRPRAILLAEEAIEMYPQVSKPDTAYWVRGLWNLARCQELNDNIEPAENAVQLAMQLCEGSKTVPVSTKFLVFYEAGMLNLNFHDGEGGGLEIAQQALAYAKSYTDPMYVVVAYELVAGIHRKRGNTVAQRRTLEQNDNFLSGKQGLEYLVGDVNVSLADAYRLERNYRKAMYHADRAVEIQKVYDPGYLHYGIVARAKVNLATEKYDEALEGMNQAIVGFERGGTEYLAGIPYFIADSLSDAKIPTIYYDLRAELFSKLERPDLALKDMEAIIALREARRQGANLAESKRYLSEVLSGFYGEAINLHLQMRAEGEEHLWSALWLTDRAKGFSLLAGLNEQRLREEEKLIGLRAEIAEIEKKDDRSTAETNRLAVARLDLDRLLRRLRRDLPAPKPYTVPDMKQQLASLEADVLAYHFGHDSSYLFHVTPAGQISVKSLPHADTIVRTITAWRSAIEKGAFRAKSLRDIDEQSRLDGAFQRIGTELSSTLLPEASALSTDLVIVPDGPVNYLPFGSLFVGSLPEPFDYKKVPYLQRGRRLRFTYSLRYLNEVGLLPRQSAAHDLIAFAPAFGGTATAAEVSRSVGDESSRSLPALAPLLYNTEEVKRITNGLGNALSFMGGEATRSNFDKMAVTGNIIHLSSHGMVNATDPNRSFVAFAQTDTETDLDELLFFNELPTLDLNAELVVLSACETSLGSIAPGENVQSLGSAFAAAGAKGTLTTLWKVDDEAIQQLMVGFYERLQSGMTRSEALAGTQEAQLNGETFAHPYYWAGVSLHGVDDPIELEGPTSSLLYYLLALAGVFGLGWWLVSKRN